MAEEEEVSDELPRIQNAHCNPDICSDSLHTLSTAVEVTSLCLPSLPLTENAKNKILSIAMGCGPTQDVSPQTRAFPVFSEKVHKLKSKRHIYTTNAS